MSQVFLRWSVDREAVPIWSMVASCHGRAVVLQVRVAKSPVKVWVNFIMTSPFEAWRWWFLYVNDPLNYGRRMWVKYSNLASQSEDSRLKRWQNDAEYTKSSNTGNLSTKRINIQLYIQLYSPTEFRLIQQYSQVGIFVVMINEPYSVYIQLNKTWIPQNRIGYDQSASWSSLYWIVNWIWSILYSITTLIQFWFSSRFTGSNCWFYH